MDKKAYKWLRTTQVTCATCMDMPQLDKDWRLNEELGKLQCIRCYEVSQGLRCEHCEGKKVRDRLCRSCTAKLKKKLLEEKDMCLRCGEQFRHDHCTLDKEMLQLVCTRRFCIKPRD